MEKEEKKEHEGKWEGDKKKTEKERKEKGMEELLR